MRKQQLAPPRRTEMVKIMVNLIDAKTLLDDLA
jgi:hypothetical protein